MTGPAASAPGAAPEIAIVGRACRLPGAPSVAALWDLLVAGRCAVTRVPADRWSQERLGHPRVAERGRSYTWAAGVLDDVWGFDPGAFGMSPREAEMIDPQQRLLLELTWEALEDAGIRPSALAGTEAGVFVGASGVDHSTLRMLDMASADAYMMTGNTLSVIANRVSYIFDLHGPSFVVDTACSSGLVALNEAVVNLRAGRMDTAIVGGVGILAAPHAFVGFSQAAMLSRRGLCQAFSADADGYVRAEGGVVLVLKTLAAATRDGDAVLGLIAAAGINSDGRTNGISLPSRAYQARLLDRLYADVDPDDLAFIEAHGTGTPVGDPIEAAAIGEAIGRRRRIPLPIGSVKTNIGHMEAVAGLGGLLKASLALEHGVLPASLHCDEPNPAIDFAGLGLTVAREPAPLPARRDGRRHLAGVNSFGFGGTNAHAILAEAPAPAAAAVGALPPFMVVSAHGRAALQALAADYATRLDAAGEPAAAALMAGAAHRRDLLPHRLALPVAGRAEAAASLRDFAADARASEHDLAHGTAVGRDVPVAFVFSGNGSQFAGMGLAAYRTSARFRAELDRVSAEFERLAGWSIVDTLHGDGLAATLGLTEFAQPLLFAIQSAACRALRAGGLEPAFAIGHSVGEVAAAEAAGLISRRAALRVILARSRHQELTRGQGGMAVAIGPREAVDAMLADFPALTVAAVNSPRAVTLSGPTDEMARLSSAAGHGKVRVRKLDLAYPFHSALMAPVEAPLLRSLRGVRRGRPGPETTTFLSTVTGTALDAAALDNRYWWRNVRDPVLFSDAVGEAARRGARVFVEIGPNPVLLSHIADSVDERTATVAVVPSLDKREGDPIAGTIAAAITRGARFDRARVLGPPPAPGSRVPLPSYPWQRTSFRLPDTRETASTIAAAPWHPLIGARYGAERLEWFSTLDTALHPALADHCVDGRAILPGAAFAEMALAVARDWLGTEAAAIAELEIASPMPLAADAAREVTCRVSPALGQVEILSRPRLRDAPWQSHATAKLLRDPALGDTRLEAGSSGSPVEGATIYALAERAGLAYGPAYRKLAHVAVEGPDRLHLVLVAPDDEGAAPMLGLDPARLDSCFHALVLVAAELAAGRREDEPAAVPAAYVPVRFGEMKLHRPGHAFTRGRIDVRRRDDRAIIADITLAGADGAVVLELREARFQALRAARAAEVGRSLIHQVAVLASEPTAARNDRPLPRAAFRPAPATEPAAMSDDFVLLEGWATSLALRAARAFAIDGVVDVPHLVAGGRLPPPVGRWLDGVLVSLDHSGLVDTDAHGRRRVADADLPAPDDILRTLALEHQRLSAELLVAAGAATAVAALEAGDTPARVPRTLDAFDLSAGFARDAAERLVALVRRALDDRPRDRATRILQLGFGPASADLAELAREVDARLTVFDPDRRRAELARVALGHDADVSDALADLPAAAFDLVVASNALVRCHGRAGFWPGLRRVMAQSAILAAVEPAPSLFRDLALGLDAALAACAEGGAEASAEAHGPTPTEAEWLAMLRAAALSEPAVDPVATGFGGALLLGAAVEAERRVRGGTGAAWIVGDSDADSPAALATLLASSGLHVSLLAEDEIDGQADAPNHVVVFPGRRDAAPARDLARRCLALKRLAGQLGRHPATLWLVLPGGIAPDDGAAGDVAAGLWAFSRTLANEVPSLAVRRVDPAAALAPGLLAERLCDLLLSGTDEADILLDADATRVLRFTAERHGDGRGGAEAARLARGTGGGERLVWEACERRAPDADEVEIRVEAVGLNFRDVMFGLGLLPEDILEHGFAGPTLGLECAGRIERVGPKVRTLKPGDRVMGFARHAFATHATTAAAVVAPLPDAMPAEMAATVPVAFLTAYHGLITCARLKRGEWVLIHGGAGGVGLAALQVARWRGARVIATAGTPERRALLRALGAEHAFDSRTGTFADAVRRVTGAGVAVVLNSLSGEAMERSLGVLRPFGRFVELGKRDYVANTHVGLRPFRRNLSYFGVDLDQLLIDDPAGSRALMRAVMGLFARGELVPLPYRAFPARDTAEAFRLMQQSGHVGKLVVRPPEPGTVAAPSRTRFAADPERLHLVTGGLGGFGLATARWLASRGARHLLLLGRGAPSDETRAVLDDLAAAGISVGTEAIDVADRSALQPLFARFGRDLPELAGVVHAAMVLDDATVANLTAAQLDRVLHPKCAGADLLDRLTRGRALDYFVLYSSATTLVGNPGQAAYVAANGALEGLARRRRRAGLPALAIAWGAIKDVGVLTRSGAARDGLAARAGIKPMLAQDALDAMGEVLAAGHGRSPERDAVVAIAPVAWATARAHLPVLNAPAYRQLAVQGGEASSSKEKVDIARLAASHPPEEARAVIGNLIADEIARVLRLPAQDVARTAPLSEIGLDSLMAVELALGLEDRFVLDAPLATTASSFSVNELADHIIGLAASGMRDGAAQQEQVARRMAERHLGAEVIGALVKGEDDFREQAELVRAKSHRLKGVLD